MDTNNTGTPQQQIIGRLKSANNILVTVSNNPSVDQLAACIGLTILLNKMNKHATAVFSGQVPSTIEFLKPEETIEKNTDSLRDFIIALDKSKADKLRYKVEENVVKIFITPYRTSLSEADLNFSQGDFNVDVVVCLGVREQTDLDQAITAHGRILHDATVVSVNRDNTSELGSINWTDPTASSLSELATTLSDALGRDLIDGQIATALLTGIVAETERFSNDKTTPNTMKLSAELMTAGANQQLVATELEESVQGSGPANGNDQSTPPPAKNDDGTLEITHAENPVQDRPAPPEPPADDQSTSKDDTDQQEPPAAGPPASPPPDENGETSGPTASPAPHLVMEPPSFGGQLTANTEPEGPDNAVNPLMEAASGNGELPEPLLDHDISTAAPAGKIPEPPLPDSPTPGPSITPPAQPAPEPSTEDSAAPAPPAPFTMPEPVAPDSDDDATQPTPSANETLTDLEQAVHSPHLADASDQPADDSNQNQPAAPTADLEDARSAVLNAINSAPATTPLPPKQDVGASGYLNVQDLPGMQDDQSAVPEPSAPTIFPHEPAPAASTSPADTPLEMPLPPSINLPPANPIPPTSTNAEPTTPPPVPPPMTELPPFMNQNQK